MEHPDRAIARLAGRQHGVVARRQLVALPLGAGAIDHRLRRGRLHPLHRGVYAVGHRALSREGRWMAAVLAGGNGAALSHRSAGALWGILPNARTDAEITVPVTRRRRPGLEQHQSILVADELTAVDGVPVTTAARTLLDLAAVVRPHQLRRAVEEAEVRRLWDRLSVADLLDRHRGRRGTAELSALVADAAVGLDVTRSDLEARFLAAVIDAGLPRPRANVPLEVGGRVLEPDFAWPERRVAVELDGHAFHATRASFEDDRARDRALHAAGWRVIRVTARQLLREREAVRADLVRALTA